jgi:NADH-quinone oxidoreductase subunit I
MVSTVPPAVRPQTRHERAPGLRGYFSNIRSAVTSTFEGMSVTASWMFRRPMTIQYPDKIAKPIQETLPDSYRGVLEVDLDRCTGCLICQRACPIGCIDISVCKNPVTGTRDLEKFNIDIGLCMYCGLCAEACNFDALVHTSEFEATVSRPEDLTLRFVREPQPVSKQKTGEGVPRKPKGSILASIIPSFGRRLAQPAPPARPVAPAAEPAPAPVASAPVPPEATPSSAPVPPAVSPAPPAAPAPTESAPENKPAAENTEQST